MWALKSAPGKCGLRPAFFSLTLVKTPSGKPLAWLALLWITGRLLPLPVGYVPAPVIALVDLAFLPAVAPSIAPPLWQGKQKINRIFAPLLLAMALANLLMHQHSAGGVLLQYP
jgi:uncharacterized protein involved in response to NO